MRSYRQDRRWSQEELAKKMTDLGFSWNQSTVTRTESATRPIRVDEADALATLFNVPVENLLRDKHSPVADRVRMLLLRKGALLREAETIKNRTEEISNKITAIDQEITALEARDIMEGLTTGLDKVTAELGLG